MEFNCHNFCFPHSWIMEAVPVEMRWLIWFSEVDPYVLCSHDSSSKTELSILDTA